MKSAILLAVLLSATTLSVLAVEPASRYVGMRYSGRADDFSFGEGYMITDEYSVSVVSKSGQRMWWLSKLLFRDKRGSPIWQVVAAMDTPKVPAGYTLFMAVCNKKGIKGGSIIAAARFEKDKTLTADIHSAWLVDLENKSFRSYPTEGVTCWNEGPLHHR